MLCSPARRTGFPAAGQENIPSHCPHCVTGSPCAPLGTMSIPTLATKENTERCLAFYAELPPASFTKGPALGETVFLMAVNERPSSAVGWPLRWKICGSPRKKKLYLRQTNVWRGGGEEQTPASSSKHGADSCPRSVWGGGQATVWWGSGGGCEAWLGGQGGPVRVILGQGWAQLW